MSHAEMLEKVRISISKHSYTGPLKAEMDALFQELLLLNDVASTQAALAFLSDSMRKVKSEKGAVMLVQLLTQAARLAQLPEEALKGATVGPTEVQ